MQTFSFVILHYQTIEDTIECVESILHNVKFEQINIVIVDNGSPNKTGKLLAEKYQRTENVYCIESKINLGFAKGNNLGFSYAKYELKSDFICLLNNDTIIKQPDFIDKIIAKYQESSFHVMGPDIISTMDGKHQNPEIENVVDINSAKRKIKHYKRLYFLNKLHIENKVVQLKRRIKPRPKPVIPDHTSEQVNAKLHGSCLVFSKLFIEKYDGLYSKTFMYNEESILYFIVKRDRLLSVYYPEIKILHKEDSSTNYQFPKDYKKRRFYYKNLIASLKVLMALMKEKE